jgi:hypothetical protein
MAAEADERPKRRRYTTAERMKILEAVDEVGESRRHVVTAFRRRP